MELSTISLWQERIHLKKFFTNCWMRCFNAWPACILFPPATFSFPLNDLSHHYLAPHHRKASLSPQALHEFVVQKIILSLPVNFAPFLQVALIFDIIEAITFILQKLISYLEASLGNRTSFLSEIACI